MLRLDQKIKKDRAGLWRGQSNREEDTRRIRKFSQVPRCEPNGRSTAINISIIHCGTDSLIKYCDTISICKVAQ
jgi:hypothetical protein